MKHWSKLSLLVILPGLLWSDGKMFHRETIPPDIPYQRAILLFQNETQTMILQSKYELPEGSESPEIGWVVPVPGVPELASVESIDAFRLFINISFGTLPKQIHLVHWGIGILALTPIVCLLVHLFLRGLKPTSPKLIWWMNQLKPRSRFFLYAFAFWLLLSIALPGFQKARSSAGVDILHEQQVGRYDAKVIQATDATDLISWLKENGFTFTEEDTNTFSRYIEKGWSFVTATMRTGKDDEMLFVEGLPDPLVLTFSTPQPIYPLALTATGGFDTEVLLYLIGDHEYACERRMELRYAGHLSSYRLAMLQELLPDQHLLFEQPILTKFKQTLTPEEMREDLVFDTVETHRPYREKVLRW